MLSRLSQVPRAAVMATRAASSLPDFVLNAPATEVTTLDNGLRVASEGGHGETATVGVWVDAGSRYETAENNGTAHFLEHLAFKGTANRSQQQLEVEIENLGGHLNAYTSREQTVYHAKVFKDDVPKAMELLSDILLQPTLDAAAIERERGVILREAEEIAKMHDEVVFDMLHETAYQGTGLGRTILGPVENIQSLTRDHLESFIKTHYHAPRMVVAGAGAVEHAQLAELAAKHFGGMSDGAGVAAAAPQDVAMFTGSDIRHRDDELPQAHVALAFETPSASSEHAFPLMIMQTLIGDWERTSTAGRNASSKLAQAASELGLAKSFQTFCMGYSDSGLFGVYMVAEPKELNDMMWYTLDALVRLCHEVTDEEIERAKVQLKASTLGQLDGSSAVCEEIGRQMLTHGRRISAPEVFARIDAVDAAAVKAAAKAVIDDKDHALAAWGPITELGDYNWIRRRSYWMRY